MTTIHPRVTSSATISKKPRKDKIEISFFVFVIEIGGLGILLRYAVTRFTIVKVENSSGDGIIFLFDLQSSDLAFQDIRVKLALIKKLDNMGDKPMLLCGNKVDLPAAGRVHARAAAEFAKRAQLNYYYEIFTIANRNIIEPFELIAKLLEYRRTPRHLQVITGPRLTNPQRIIDPLQELIENEGTIASIITPADNVVEDDEGEEEDDHSFSRTQRAFIQHKRDCMGSFVGEDVR